MAGSGAALPRAIVSGPSSFETPSFAEMGCDMLDEFKKFALRGNVVDLAAVSIFRTTSSRCRTR
jgi:hypothetical protein